MGNARYISEMEFNAAGTIQPQPTGSLHELSSLGPWKAGCGSTASVTVAAIEPPLDRLNTRVVSDR